MTQIEWATKTWEPLSGCTKVSAGCAHCYALTLAEGRLKRFYPEGFGKVRIHPDRLEQPLHWRKPQRVFVCSRADLFHEEVPDAFLEDVFQVISMAEEYEMGHTFLILTKRAERMADWMEWVGEQPNIWLGVSVENQAAAEERIPLLLQTPAAVRFVSAEPLLEQPELQEWIGGPDSYGDCGHCGEAWPSEGGHACPPGFGPCLDWVIAGGESGPGARRAELRWFRGLVDQCYQACAPLFIKQMGSILGRELGCRDRRGADMEAWPKDLRVREYPRER